MPRYIVLSKFDDSALRHLREHPDFGELRSQVEELGGKVVEQHYLLGKFDVMTVIDVHEAEAAQLLRLATRANRVVLPAIDQDLFVRLLGRSAENTGPHQWQTQAWARAVRRCFRGYIYTRPLKRACSTFDVKGTNHLADLRGPAIYIANHSSHLDAPAIFGALPRQMRGKVAFAAAADRFYVKGRPEMKKQGWWFSLMWNMFPMKRGGGRASLAHAEFLIDKGVSIAIFPEGGRSSHDKLARFRVGPALLALSKDVPVVPMYLDGLRHIRPKGTNTISPGPVAVHIGEPLRFAAGTDAQLATKHMEAAVRALQAAAHPARPSRPVAVVSA
jgi:1-acyl-sn-glycerol-3-phosphate acyltransferase